MDFVSGYLCWRYKRRSCIVTWACTFIHCCWRRYLTCSQVHIPFALIAFYYFCMIDTDLLFSMIVIIIEFVIAEHRHVGSNNFNLFSSRSHTIFTLVIFLSLIVGVWSCNMILPKHMWCDCWLNFMNLGLVLRLMKGHLILSLVTMPGFTLFWSGLL